MIGVEEEFFIVNDESLFPISSTPRVIINLIKRESRYLVKSSMESPLDKELMRTGFPIVELKTSPHRDVDLLLDEIRHHRETLAEVARDDHLLIVPSGLYPTHDPKKDSHLLCCAIHVHVSGYPLKKAFYALVKHIPILISVAANSPLLSEKTCGKAMRVLYSYAVGLPVKFYKRKSDVIINRKLQTVELRVCDTQIVCKDVLNLVNVILSVIDSHSKLGRLEQKLDRLDLEKKRLMAAIAGKSVLQKEVEEMYEVILPSLEEFGRAEEVYEYLTGDFLPADFQIDIAKKYGRADVIQSLWASFRSDNLRISNTAKNVRRDNTVKFSNLPYLSFYFPIHIYKIYKKFKQDDIIRTVFLERGQNQSQRSETSLR